VLKVTEPVIITVLTKASLGIKELFPEAPLVVKTAPLLKEADLTLIGPKSLTLRAEFAQKET